MLDGAESHTIDRPVALPMKQALHSAVDLSATDNRMNMYQEFKQYSPNVVVDASITG